MARSARGRPGAHGRDADAKARQPAPRARTRSRLPRDPVRHPLLDEGLHAHERAQVHHVVGHRRAGILVGRHHALLELAVEQGPAQRDCDAATMRATSASTSSSSASGAATRLSAGLGIDVGDLELPARRRRRRAPADHTHPRHGKAVLRPDRPTSSKSATYVRTPQPRPQTNPELRNLDPNRTISSAMSRPVEDCEGCPALAGVRNLGLDDPSAGRPDSHCNSGDRRIRACRAAAALSQFPQAGTTRFTRRRVS